MKLRALCAIAMAALLCACGVKQQALPPKEANSPHPAQDPPTVPQEPTPGSAEELLIPDPLTGASPAMNSAAFWIDLDKTADEPRMTEEERLAYRAALCEAEGTGLADLDRFAADVTGAEIRRLILLYGEAPDEGYFTGEAGDEPLGPETRREIRENSALEAVPDRALPRYGGVRSCAPGRLRFPFTARRGIPASIGAPRPGSSYGRRWWRCTLPQTADGSLPGPRITRAGCLRRPSPAVQKRNGTSCACGLRRILFWSRRPA